MSQLDKEQRILYADWNRITYIQTIAHSSEAGPPRQCQLDTQIFVGVTVTRHSTISTLFDIRTRTGKEHGMNILGMFRGRTEKSELS